MIDSNEILMQELASEKNRVQSAKASSHLTTRVTTDRHMRVKDTQDRNFLNRVVQKKMFNDEKHRLGNLLKEMGLPELGPPEYFILERRCMRLGVFDPKLRQKLTKEMRLPSPSSQNGDTEEEVKKDDHALNEDIEEVAGDSGSFLKSTERGKSSAVSNSHKSYTLLKVGKKVKKVRKTLDGDTFSFQNKDRYKTDQYKYQAMALTVPGYLQNVFGMNQ